MKLITLYEFVTINPKAKSYFSSLPADDFLSLRQILDYYKSVNLQNIVAIYEMLKLEGSNTAVQAQLECLHNYYELTNHDKLNPKLENIFSLCLDYRNLQSLESSKFMIFDLDKIRQDILKNQDAYTAEIQDNLQYNLAFCELLLAIVVADKKEILPSSYHSLNNFENILKSKFYYSDPANHKPSPIYQQDINEVFYRRLEYLQIFLTTYK